MHFAYTIYKGNDNAKENLLLFEASISHYGRLGAKVA
jgi:hypothetical protein